jgi:transposase
MGNIAQMENETKPNPAGKRWTALRKAAVIDRLFGGTLTRDAAMLEYDLTEEELNEWLGAYRACGTDGLQVTKRARSRSKPSRQHRRRHDTKTRPAQPAPPASPGVTTRYD